MTTREQWIAGARPKTLPAAIAPVLVGTAFAGYNATVLHTFLALIVALALQVGVNYANDYSDGIKGTDADRVGPMRLVGSGAATAKDVKNAAFISFAIAAIAGLILASRTSWLLIILGAICILAAWTYTGGPKPYGYQALGEVSVFIFFGVVATVGTYYVQTESVSREVLLASFAMGALACAILVLNNLRDLENDKSADKKTLAVVMGDQGTRDLYKWLMFFALAMSVALTFFSFFYLLALLSLPLVSKSVRAVNSGASGTALIDLLAKTGRIQIIYALALSFAALLVAR
ncbi:MAG TPA: 1,4-dihydroxy-2-naphthoate polyprenyltransferase [Candidatus Nanopelagicaceae bacterium]|nr:1,4-dihydroxy-2-naphthoate polyprenyltransferase [Candidatus Nanopelagicaceae bacterium]